MKAIRITSNLNKHNSDWDNLVKMVMTILRTDEYDLRVDENAMVKRDSYVN